MKEEIWKPLPSLNGLIQVSNLGNVREYITTKVNGKTIVCKERYLSKHLSKSGYKIGYKGYYFLVSRLMAEAFKKDFNIEKYVIYKDGIMENLTVENLICVDNNYISHCGEKNSKAKLKDEDILEICRKALSGTSCKEIAKIYGISKISVSKILRKVIWKHVERPYISLRVLSHDKRNKEIIKFLGKPIIYKQKHEK